MKFINYRKILLLIGMFSVLFGASWILMLAKSSFTIPETEEVLSPGRELVYRDLHIPANTHLTVSFECFQKNGKVESMLMDKNSFEKFKTGENTTVEVFMRKVGRNDTLSYYFNNKDQYFLVFKTVYLTGIKELNNSLPEEQRFHYYPAQLENDTQFDVDIMLKNKHDSVRLMIVNQTILDKMLVLWIPPEGSVYAEESGNETVELNWVAKNDKKFYIVVLPLSSDWPVEYSIKLYAIKIDGAFPVNFKYSANGTSDGPWILGLVPILVGTILIILVTAVKPSKLGKSKTQY
ncbi:hypothetical protein [[Eubacterium] cellulosolvens]